MCRSLSLNILIKHTNSQLNYPKWSPDQSKKQSSNEAILCEQSIFWFGKGCILKTTYVKLPKSCNTESILCFSIFSFKSQYFLVFKMVNTIFVRHLYQKLWHFKVATFSDQFQIWAKTWSLQNFEFPEKLNCVISWLFVKLEKWMIPF